MTHASIKNGHETTRDVCVECFLCARHWDFRAEQSQQNEDKFRAIGLEVKCTESREGVWDRVLSLGAPPHIN